MSDRQDGFRGKTIEQIQADFFLKRLPRAKGRYRFPSSGLNADRGAVVLFQFKARVIAAATFLGNEKYDQPVDGFAGAMHVDPATIRVFDPWDADAMRRVWPGFRAFGHVKQFLNPGNWQAFERRLKGVRSPVMATIR